MADSVQQYHEIIGQLRWAVDTVLLDIVLETLLLLSYLAIPRVGHLDQAFHIFGYLKVNPKRSWVLTRIILPLRKHVPAV